MGIYEACKTFVLLVCRIRHIYAVNEINFMHGRCRSVCLFTRPPRPLLTIEKTDKDLNCNHVVTLSGNSTEVRCDSVVRNASSICVSMGCRQRTRARATSQPSICRHIVTGKVLLQDKSACTRKGRNTTCLVNSFMQSFVIPLVRNKDGDIIDGNSYRAITIPSAASKLFELIDANQFKVDI